MGALKDEIFSNRPEEIKPVDVDAQTRDTINNNMKVDKELSDNFLHPEKRRTPKKEEMVDHRVTLKVEAPVVVRKIDLDRDQKTRDMVKKLRTEVALLTSENLRLEDEVFKDCPKELQLEMISGMKIWTRGIEYQFLHFVSGLRKNDMPWSTIAEAMKDFQFDRMGGKYTGEDDIEE